MNRLRIFLFFLLLMTLPLFGEEFFIEKQNYSVDIPEGWKTLDRSDLSELSFVSDDQKVVFQISVFDGSKYRSSMDMFEDLTSGFRISSDGERFKYNGDDAYLADITFSDGSNTLRGWFLFINREDKDYYLFAFSGKDFYEEKFPFILSVLDGFRIESNNSKRKPGAVSQFYYPFPGKGDVTAQMTINGDQIRFQTDIMEFDASQAVIEREAKVMKYYQDIGDKPLFEKAWKRYYKVIFRDNYSRFNSLTDALKKEFKGKSNKEISEDLLGWIQTYEYASSGTFSDLLSPVSAVAQEKGDCDARGLSYSLMLSHFGIDSLLLVSWQYKHSISAVDIPGEGARYPYENKTYLIGETTEVVDMGMIPQSMADSSKWIPVAFF